MSSHIPQLIAEKDPRVARDMAVYHYLSTPPISSEAEYAHYVAETARLIRSLKPGDPPEVVASVWAVVDRALDYNWHNRPQPGETGPCTLH